MNRRPSNLLFATAAALSFLLALGCLYFWIFTLHGLYLTAWGDDPSLGHPVWIFGSAGGRFQLVYDNGQLGNTPISHAAWAGIEYSRFKSGWNLWIPWWLPTALLCPAPGLWIVRARRNAARRKTGHCPACGYDLRASPERCPECGREI